MKTAAPKGAAISWVQEFEGEQAARVVLNLAAGVGLSVAEKGVYLFSLRFERAGRTVALPFALCRTNQRHAGIITKRLNDFQRLIFAFEINCFLPLTMIG
jgi:hypothetical protein